MVLPALRVTGPITPIGEPGMNRCAGFTYLGVLFVVALMGTLLALAGESWHTASKREKERELLYIGKQFRDAIGLYYNRTPGNLKKFPRSLEDLLKDPRQLTTQRYLRKVYVDPMMGTTEWGIIKSADGGIAGVFSQSEAAPMKIAQFGDEYAGFENAEKYSDWKFVFRPPAQRPGVPPPNPAVPAPQVAPPPPSNGPPTVYNSPVD